MLSNWPTGAKSNFCDHNPIVSNVQYFLIVFYFTDEQLRLFFNIGRFVAKIQICTQVDQQQRRWVCCDNVIIVADDARSGIADTCVLPNLNDVRCRHDIYDTDKCRTRALGIKWSKTRDERLGRAINTSVLFRETRCRISFIPF